MDQSTRATASTSLDRPPGRKTNPGVPLPGRRTRAPYPAALTLTRRRETSPGRESGAEPDGVDTETSFRDGPGSARGLKEGRWETEETQVGFYPFRGPDASCTPEGILP